MSRSLLLSNLQNGFSSLCFLSSAWIGTGWVGCAPASGPEGSGLNQTYVRPAEVDVDYGSPTGLCKESAPNVFTREYTKAT